MVNHATDVDQPLSPSVGDYVKAIWKIAGPNVTSTNEVSSRLSVSSASVTGMLARLQEMGLVEYERYRGASLTRRGRIEALRLVRRHRLIETFLVEHLEYSWEEVHEEAEKLEHAVSDEFTERLAELLRHPDRDPHGDPIPRADGTLAEEDSYPLSEAMAGARVCIIRVSDDNAAVLTYLGEHGLVPGEVVSVKEVRSLDGVITVEDEDGNPHSLGQTLTHSVFVVPVRSVSERAHE